MVSRATPTGMMQIAVECYAGYRGEETPRRFRLHERTFEVANVVDQRLAPTHRCFKVRTTDGELCIIRHDVESNAWELTLFERATGH